MRLKKHMTHDRPIFYVAGVTGRVIFCHPCVWLEEVFVLRWILWISTLISAKKFLFFVRLSINRKIYWRHIPLLWRTFFLWSERGVEPPFQFMKENLNFSCYQKYIEATCEMWAINLVLSSLKGLSCFQIWKHNRVCNLYFGESVPGWSNQHSLKKPKPIGFYFSNNHRSNRLTDANGLSLGGKLVSSISKRLQNPISESKSVPTWNSGSDFDYGFQLSIPIPSLNKTRITSWILNCG